MKNKNIILYCAFFLFFASNVVLVFQMQVFLKNQKTENERFRNQISEELVKIEEKITGLSEDYERVSSELNENQKNSFQKLEKDVSAVKTKTEFQYSKTLAMSETYDEILSEQKKKSLDTVSQETAVQNIKEEADRLYKSGQYAKAYKEYKKVIEYQKDDMESRMKKMKSLYYTNPSDSSKYEEILDDIRLLKATGSSDEESKTIEKMILNEKEGFDE